MITKAKAFAVDFAERVGSTFVQVLLVTLLAAYGSTRIDWANALAVAGFAAATAAVTTLALWAGLIKAFTNPYADLAYRTVVTFLQAIVGIMAAAGVISALSFDWDTAVKTALVAAGTALLKGLIGLHSATLGASTFVPAQAALAVGGSPKAVFGAPVYADGPTPHTPEHAAG